MKLKACLAAGLLGLTFGPASAEPARPMFAGDLLTPPQAADVVRSMGFTPTGTPVRQGLVYVVRAVGPRGRPMRVVVDARFGDVLSVRPVATLGAPYPVPPGRIAVRPLPYEHDRPWLGPQFRPPAPIGRSDAPPPVPRARPAPDAAKPPQQSAAGPTGSAAPAAPLASSKVLTVRPAAPAATGTDPTPTGSTPKAPAFPPAQTLE